MSVTSFFVSLVYETAISAERSLFIIGSLAAGFVRVARSRLLVVLAWNNEPTGGLYYTSSVVVVQLPQHLTRQVATVNTAGFSDIAMVPIVDAIVVANLSLEIYPSISESNSRLGSCE